MTLARPVGTVDVLPVDMQLWTHQGSKRSPDDLVETFENRARGSMTAVLANLGYDVVATIDWRGTYTAGDGRAAQAMSEADLVATANSLSGYGHAVAEAGQGVPVPFLPVRLGTRTGSDATLYIGGWAYVGDDGGSSTGTKVAKGILIGALVLVVIAVVIIGMKRGGGGGGGGKVAGAAGRAAAGSGRAVGRAAGGIGRAAARTGRVVMRGMARGTRAVAEGMWRSADALGRTHTHIDIYSGRPDYFEQKKAPKKGRSRTYIEMTLIDNVTGQTLWHARQNFAASASNSRHVVEMIHRMMATFPAQP